MAVSMEQQQGAMTPQRNPSLPDLRFSRAESPSLPAEKLNEEQTSQEVAAEDLGAPSSLPEPAPVPPPLDVLAEASTTAPAETVAVRSKTTDLYAYMKDGMLYIYGRVSDYPICIKVKTQAMQGYALVSGKALDVMQLAKTKSLASYELVWQQVLEAYRRVQATSQKIPVPLVVKNSAMYIANKGSTVAVFVKGKSMYVQGQVGSAVLAVRVRGANTVDLAKGRVVDTFNCVAQKVEPYLLKAQGSLVSAKGKVQGVAVSIKSKAQSKALYAYSEIKAAIEGLPMTAKVRDGVTVLQGKLNKITVYVKDGYMYGVSQIGDATFFVKAKVSKVQGAAQVKVLEAYSRSRDMSSNLATYALSIVDATKQKADKKPVTAGAAAGAMLGGASGGAVGGVAGGVAGGMAGMPFALFTLGLSIPVGALLGGGVGASAGAVTGGAAGALTGSTAGFGYGHRDEIRNSVQSTLAKAGTAKSTIQGKVMSQVESVKDRLVSGTGSTA